MWFGMWRVDAKDVFALFFYETFFLYLKRVLNSPVGPKYNDYV